MQRTAMKDQHNNIEHWQELAELSEKQTSVAEDNKRTRNVRW